MADCNTLSPEKNIPVEGESNQTKWLEDKMKSIGDWAAATFPRQTARGKLCHLREEIEELIEAIDSGKMDEIKAEYADCAILLVDAARAAGLTADEIDAAIENKMRINKSRKWSKPDENGVCHHVK